MIEVDEIYLTLICLNDPELDDDAYEAYIGTVALELTKRLGALHGLNALKVLGKRIVHCTYHIDRDLDSVSTVDVRCTVPDGMTTGDVVDVITTFWSNVPLGGDEYYLR